MSNELIREKIILDQKIGNESSQVLIEGDLIVPDIKPDMAVILQTDAKICIERTEVSNDRVSFVGRLDVQVLYLARGSEKPVHSMNVSTSVDDFINIEGVNKDMWVEVKAKLTNIDYKMLNDRKINYRAIVDIIVSCEKTEEHEIVIDISDIPENQLLKTTLSLNRSIENKISSFTIKDEELILPSGKPNIREILQSNVSISNKEIRVGNGKVTVNGELVLVNLYRGEDDSSLIEFVEHEIPFNGFVELSETREDMTADVNLVIQECRVQAKPDNDGEDRVFDAEIVVGITAKVHCQEKFDILEDAYCINQELSITKAPIKYPRLICRNKNQSPIKEVVSLGDNCPDILQIFNVKGIPHVDETKIIDDKVVVEGVIEADILYVAENDTTPLYSYQTVIPFRQIIETKGSEPGMLVEMDCNVDHIGFNMLSGRETELRFLLSFNTQVTKEEEKSMITDIVFEEMDKSILDNMPSMIVYVVQKGDDIWRIAKQYNTSIDEILNVNEIEVPGKVSQGQKLLILKKSI